MTEFRSQKKYEEKLRQKGMVRVTVWVPEKDKKALTQQAEDMRRRALGAKS
jgi:hypothetical protein